MVASSTVTTTTTTTTLRPGKGKKEEVHDHRMIDGESIDGVALENFTGFRKTAREFLLPYVKSGSNVIVSIQAYQHPYLTLFWNAISIVGSHDFFIAFFPFIIFGFGLRDIGGRLLQYAALSVYLGNIFKDYLCLPRPGPPVVQLDAHSSHGHEFGFPSTHSVSAVCLPFYLLFSQFSVYDPNFVYFFGLAVCYYLLVVFSRLYLGMHSIADIVGGSLIGASVLLGGLIVDVLDLYHLFPQTPASMFMTGIVLLLIHPEPYAPCPCFPDSACFLGSSFGLLVGITRLNQYFIYAQNTVSLYLFLTRWLIGAALLFGGRVVYKPIIRKVGYTLFNMLGLPSRTFVHAHNAKPFSSPKWDLEILLKYVCYFAMCEVTLEFGPQIMDVLGLNI